MSYKPKLLPIEEVMKTVENLNTDFIYEASKNIKSPKIKRSKENGADFWHSIKVYLSNQSEKTQ